MTLTTPAERDYLRSQNKPPKTTTITNLTERLEQDAVIWGAMPPLNAQVGGIYGPQRGYEPSVVFGANGLTMDELNAQHGRWELPVKRRYDTSPNTVLLVNSNLNLQYTIAGDASPGPRDIALTNPDQQFALAAGGFTVIGQGTNPPVALFAAAPTDGPMPLTVTFTDASTGTITNRIWSFGDGVVTNTISTHVVHTYRVVPPGDLNKDGHVTGADSLLLNQVGVGLRATNSALFQTNFTVRLIVEGPAGSSTNTQTSLVALGVFPNGDVDQDDAATAADSLLINQVMVGLRSYLVTKIEPASRADTNVSTAALILGLGFPTNIPPTASIGTPVNLTLTQVVVQTRERISAIVPLGGSPGTGTGTVISSPTNGVLSLGRFINQ
jgi:hypothetical protein